MQQKSISLDLLHQNICMHLYSYLRLAGQVKGFNIRYWDFSSKAFLYQNTVLLFIPPIQGFPIAQTLIDICNGNMQNNLMVSWNLFCIYIYIYVYIYMERMIEEVIKKILQSALEIISEKIGHETVHFLQ